MSGAVRGVDPVGGGVEVAEGEGHARAPGADGVAGVCGGVSDGGLREV